MGSQYAGNPASFPVDFTIPDDGDPRNAASVNVAFEALGDRTAWLSTHREVYSVGDSIETGTSVGAGMLEPLDGSQIVIDNLLEDDLVFLNYTVFPVLAVTDEDALFQAAIRVYSGEYYSLTQKLASISGDVAVSPIVLAITYVISAADETTMPIVFDLSGTNNTAFGSTFYVRAKQARVVRS